MTKRAYENAREAIRQMILADSKPLDENSMTIPELQKLRKELGRGHSVTAARDWAKKEVLAGRMERCRKLSPDGISVNAFRPVVAGGK